MPTLVIALPTHQCALLDIIIRVLLRGKATVPQPCGRRQRRRAVGGETQLGGGFGLGIVGGIDGEAV